MQPLQPLLKVADRAALGVAGALMDAAYQAPRPGGGYAARALGGGERALTALGAATWSTLAARLHGKLEDALEDALQDEAAEEVLETLLRLMQIALLVDPAYRKNVDGFRARYRFESKDQGLAVGAVFGDGFLHVREGALEAPHLTLRFSDGRALLRFLLTPDPDVLVAMLQGEVQPEGNLNYLYRLAFLAKRLQRRFGVS